MVPRRPVFFIQPHGSVKHDHSQQRTGRSLLNSDLRPAQMKGAVGRVSFPPDGSCTNQPRVRLSGRLLRFGLASVSVSGAQSPHEAISSSMSS